MNLWDTFWQKVIDLYTGVVEMLPRLILSILIVACFLLITKLVRKRLNLFLQDKADDLLTINFINSSFRVANVLLAIFLFLSLMGQTWIATSFLGAASISAIVIGFAFKDIAENFLAGIILAFKRPFKLGDTVKSGDIEGIILEINLRYTLIKTSNGIDVYLPNGQLLKNPLHNYTIDGFMRGQYVLTIGVEEDIDLARAVILQAINSTPGVLQEKKLARTHISQVSPIGIDIQAYYWVNTNDKAHSGLDVKTEAIKLSLAALKENSIALAKPPYESVSR